MRGIAITGASGFIGSRLVRLGLDRGWRVRALCRSPLDDRIAHAGDALSVHHCDLSQPGAVGDALAGVDCVIHLASPMSGLDASSESAARHISTNLLKSMADSEVNRLVLVSSIAVLDYASAPGGGIVDESTPVCERPSDMGRYARIKARQELDCGSWATASPARSLCIVRPGLVYEGALTSVDHAGIFVRNFGLEVRHAGEVPAVSVDRLTRVLLALASEKAGPGLLHCLDPRLRSQAEYLAGLHDAGIGTAALPMPWRMVATLAAAARAAIRSTSGAERVPDTLRRNSIAARLSPHRFSSREPDPLLGPGGNQSAAAQGAQG